jgi:hypothetical protein
MISAQNCHGNAHGKFSPQAVIENAAGVQLLGVDYSQRPGISAANLPKNQECLFSANFISKPFQGVPNRSKPF